MPVTTYEANGLIQASANGCNVTIAARRFRMPTLAMSVVPVTADQGKPCIRIYGRHRLQTAIVPPYAVPPNCHDLQRGDKFANTYVQRTRQLLPATSRELLLTTGQHNGDSTVVAFKAGQWSKSGLGVQGVIGAG